MKRPRKQPSTLWICALIVCAYSLGSLSAQEATSSRTLLKTFVGKWKGECKTWTRPGTDPDVSKVSGQIKIIGGTSVVRHSYTGKLMGKARTGEETIAFNAPEQEFQVSWVDTFHMNYAILFSTGSLMKNGKGFVVQSKYRMSPDQEFWTWRTEYELLNADQLNITAFNITPDGQEAKAVELIYQRTE